jgi:hypothetical protein
VVYLICVAERTIQCFHVRHMGYTECTDNIITMNSNIFIVMYVADSNWSDNHPKYHKMEVQGRRNGQSWADKG